MELPQFSDIKEDTQSVRDALNWLRDEHEDFLRSMSEDFARRLTYESRETIRAYHRGIMVALYAIFKGESK